MEHLATEIISNVLSRLSVKDLMRCKCVCKFWFNIITDPKFISNHYLFYNGLEVQRQERLLLLLRTYCIKTEIAILSWNPNEPKGLLSSHFLDPSITPIPREEYCSNVDIIGPCNGIYFLRGFPSIITNPSLRQFITLPPSPDSCKLGKLHWTNHYYKYPTGFGFDPKTNDYKVVKIPQRLMPMKKWVVELYSLNSNSWKILEDNSIPFPFAQLSENSLFFSYVNNCCHWWGCLHKSNKEQSDDFDCAVLSLDMVSELFRMIKMPKMSNQSNHISEFLMSDKNIIPFSESGTIGIIDCHNVDQGIEKSFCFDVWMLKDYWDEGSWIKLYTVSSKPVIYNKRLIGCYGGNQYLWKEGRTSLVMSALDCEENARDLLVCLDFESISAVRYMESLVSLERGRRV